MKLDALLSTIILVTFLHIVDADEIARASSNGGA
jgi:hypothetical protein